MFIPVLYMQVTNKKDGKPHNITEESIKGQLKVRQSWSSRILSCWVILVLFFIWSSDKQSCATKILFLDIVFALKQQPSRFCGIFSQANFS